MKLATATAFALAFVLSGVVTYAQADDDRRPCSTATLKGSFGYTGTGSIVSGASVLPIAFVGRVTFDGLGQASFSQILSRNGVIISVGPINSTYTVNADCTGSFTVGNGHLVIDDNGKEYRNILQNAGAVITVIGRKIRTEED
jgi:hypothetical protein